MSMTCTTLPPTLISGNITVALLISGAHALVTMMLGTTLSTVRLVSTVLRKGYAARRPDLAILAAVKFTLGRAVDTLAPSTT